MSFFKAAKQLNNNLSHDFVGTYVVIGNDTFHIKKLIAEGMIKLITCSYFVQCNAHSFMVMDSFSLCLFLVKLGHHD